MPRLDYYRFRQKDDFTLRLTDTDCAAVSQWIKQDMAAVNAEISVTNSMLIHLAATPVTAQIVRLDRDRLSPLL